MDVGHDGEETVNKDMTILGLGPFLHVLTFLDGCCLCQPKITFDFLSCNRFRSLNIPFQVVVRNRKFPT